MIFTVPIVGKILEGLAASETGAAAATQKAEPQKPGSAVDFTQTVDNLNPAAKAPQHDPLAGGRI
jgi:hypothetical protein